ncbi:MAG: MBL fold metallo-hydrolase, partial [Dehalococcoidia bacterium]|nr:MBL fold metallo-hydrolase [Dehalococcoidia bacterium]
MPVEIVWFGRTCFRIRGRSVTILTDPCPPESGYRLGKQTASIVTLSRADDPQYSYLAAVQGEPMLLDAPGEYEIGDALITALADRRPDGARNVIFVIELEGVRIAHLGLPPKAPNDTLV